MLEITFTIFICIFAAYGFLSLSFSIINSIRQRIYPDNLKVRLVLLVKNQEETIEGIIRSFFTGDWLRKIISGEKLLVLDMGSTDKTIDILHKLKDTFAPLEVLKEEEKENLFKYFDETQT